MYPGIYGNRLLFFFCIKCLYRLIVKYVAYKAYFSTTGAQALGEAAFGEGVGLIHLDDLMCDGTETSLFECTFNPTHNCAHTEDVGVNCKTNC